jgi:hypothetical protein
VRRIFRGLNNARLLRAEQGQGRIRPMEDQPYLSLPPVCTPVKCAGGSRSIGTTSRSWRRCCRRMAASRRFAGSRRPSEQSAGSSTSWGVAPPLIPVRAGDRVKTERRDAKSS